MSYLNQQEFDAVEANARFCPTYESQQSLFSLNSKEHIQVA